MRLSAYKATLLVNVVGGLIVLASALAIGDGVYAWFLLSFSVLVALYVFVLKCPRCGASTTMRRLTRGRRGILGQYYTSIPPHDCSLCGLNLDAHSLGEKVE